MQTASQLRSLSCEGPSGRRAYPTLPLKEILLQNTSWRHAVRTNFLSWDRSDLIRYWEKESGVTSFIAENFIITSLF